jgi:hypothetical protein
MTDISLDAATGPEPRSGTHQDFFLTLYQGLFSPVTFFREVAEAEQLTDEDGTVERPAYLRHAVMIVLLISGLTPAAIFIGTAQPLSSLAIQIPLSLIGGALLWLSFASLFALGAYGFGRSARLRTLLTLTGFTSLPGLLTPALVLLKVGLGVFGKLAFIIGGLGLWGWGLFLLGLALGATYRLSVERVLILLLVPHLMALVSWGWFFQLIGDISRLTR